MGLEVRAVVRPRTSPLTPAANGAVASRRDGRDDCGQGFWLWRAVDDEGEVLDLLVQPRRDKAAAVKLMRKLLKKQGFAPDVIVTESCAPTARQRRRWIVYSPRAGLAQEQPGRKIASADVTARAQDAALQNARISPAFPVDSRRHFQHLQRPAPSHIPPHTPRP